MKKEAQEFLDNLHGIVDYWVKVAEQKKLNYKDFAESVIFSVLVNIDGYSMGDPLLMFKTDDYGVLTTCINDEDILHDNWYHTK